MSVGSVLSSRKSYLALAVFHAVDAVLCAIPIPELGELLDTIDVPQHAGRVRMGWVLAVVKLLAAVGLLSVSRFPWLARLTTTMLTVYFSIAVALHIRTLHRASLMTRGAMALAAFLLALCVGMTLTRPRQD